MLTQEHIAAIEDAAQTLESATKYNSEMGRTVFSHSQAEKAKKLRDVVEQLSSARGSPMDPQYPPQRIASRVFTHKTAQADDVEQIAHERAALAFAIRDAAVRAGIVRADASLTAPQLMMLCNDLAEAHAQQDAALRPLGYISTDARGMLEAGRPITVAVTTGPREGYHAIYAATGKAAADNAGGLDSPWPWCAHDGTCSCAKFHSNPEGCETRAERGIQPATSAADAKDADLLSAPRGASHALRSYQFGNSSPDLAASTADSIDAAIAASQKGTEA